MLWLIVTLGTETPSPTVKMQNIQEIYRKISSIALVVNGEKTQRISCVTYELYVVLLVQKEVFDL